MTESEPKQDTSTPDTESRRARLIELIHADFITDVDGFTYWQPRILGGYLGSHILRTIADELDARNAEAQASLDAYFDQQNKVATDASQ